jgi:cobalt-zinc-cadmium efflux system outer membrane protein
MNPFTRRWAAVAFLLLSALGCAAPQPAALASAPSRAHVAAPGPRVLAIQLEPSQEELPGTLDAYIEHALANSSSLAASRARWRASTEQASQAGNLPDPRLSYGEFLEEVQTRTGPQERRIGLSQAFPWPGQLGAQERVAQQKASAQWQRSQGTELQVVADVKAAFHEYAFLGAELRIKRDLLNLLRGLDSVVQTRVRAGGSQADLLRLQVEIGRLEDGVASLEGRRPVLSARLEQAINRQHRAEPLPIPPMHTPLPREWKAEDLRARAMQWNSQLLEMQAKVRAQQEAVRVAKLQARPGFTLGLTSIQTGGAINPNTPGSGDDPLMVSLSLSLPVWGGKNHARRQQARELSKAASADLETMEFMVFSALEQSTYQAADAARRISLYRDSLIPRASEALDLAVAAYRTGGASVLDLIDSERALLEFELSLWRACRDYFLGEAKLELLLGNGETL